MTAKEWAEAWGVTEEEVARLQRTFDLLRNGGFGVTTYQATPYGLNIQNHSLDTTPLEASAISSFLADRGYVDFRVRYEIHVDPNGARWPSIHIDLDLTRYGQKAPVLPVRVRG